MGEEADTILLSVNITEEERGVYETVVQKFDDFFQLRRNIIFERSRFNRRNQLEGESSEQYISELYCLVDNCNYGNLKDELLRDRLVVGIRDQELSKKLQLDPDLTLEKTKKTIRQKEAVKEQHYILQGNDTKEPTLEEVRYGKCHRKSPRPEVRKQYIQRDTNSKCMNRQITHYVQGVAAQSTTVGKCAQHQVQDTTDVTKGVIISAQCFSRKVY